MRKKQLLDLIERTVGDDDEVVIELPSNEKYGKFVKIETVYGVNITSLYPVPVVVISANPEKD